MGVHEILRVQRNVAAPIERSMRTFVPVAQSNCRTGCASYKFHCCPETPRGTRRRRVCSGVRPAPSQGSVRFACDRDCRLKPTIPKPQGSQDEKPTPLLFRARSNDAAMPGQRRPESRLERTGRRIPLSVDSVSQNVAHDLDNPSRQDFSHRGLRTQSTQALVLDGW